MNKILNFAILGCGRISKSHIQAIIKEGKRCNLIAICDESLENLNKTFNYVKEEFYKNNLNFNLLKFRNLEDLLFLHNNKKINIDLLII